MPLYYLNDSLSHKGDTFEMFSVSGLYHLSEKSRNELIEAGLIRKLSTPPISHFVALEEYAIILETLGVEDSGDFAGLDPELLPDDKSRTLQQNIIDYLNPGTPIIDKDCQC